MPSSYAAPQRRASCFHKRHESDRVLGLDEFLVAIQSVREAQLLRGRMALRAPSSGLDLGSCHPLVEERAAVRMAAAPDRVAPVLGRLRFIESRMVRYAQHSVEVQVDVALLGVFRQLDIQELWLAERTVDDLQVIRAAPRRAEVQLGCRTQLLGGSIRRPPREEHSPEDGLQILAAGQPDLVVGAQGSHGVGASGVVRLAAGKQLDEEVTDQFAPLERLDAQLAQQ